MATTTPFIERSRLDDVDTRAVLPFFESTPRLLHLRQMEAFEEQSFLSIANADRTERTWHGTNLSQEPIGAQ